MSTGSGSIPSKKNRVTLECAVHSLIYNSKSKNIAQQLTQQVLQHFRSRSRISLEAAPSQAPLPSKTLANILAILPYGVNMRIFNSLPYAHLYSLCSSQNLNIKSAALTCLTQKLRQQLHISHANRENALHIFNLLSQTFDVLSEYSLQASVAIRALFENQTLDSFLTNLETIQCDQLLLLNIELLDLRGFFNAEVDELFLKLFATKISENEIQLSVLEGHPLNTYTNSLLTLALQTKNLETLKLSLSLNPNISHANLVSLVIKASRKHFYEYIEIILDHLFITTASTQNRNKTVSICNLIIKYCVLFNNVKILSTLLNKMPLNKEEAKQSIINIQESLNTTTDVKATAQIAINIIKQHYNVS